MHIDDERPERTGKAGEGIRSETAQLPLRAIQRKAGVRRRVCVEEISEAGRDYARRYTAAGNRSAPLTPRRVAELRGRIMSGFYDAPETLDQMARRILDSGELGPGSGPG